VQQHLGRLEGVSRVEVKLAEGEVVIFPKDDSFIDPERIFKATYDSGVSVTEMSFTGIGILDHDANNRPVFRISNRQIFEVVPNDLYKPFEGASSVEVSLRGQLFKKENGKGKAKTISPVRVQILEVNRK
jgi:hypothetical protein